MNGVAEGVDAQEVRIRRVGDKVIGIPGALRDDRHSVARGPHPAQAKGGCQVCGVVGQHIDINGCILGDAGLVIPRHRHIVVRAGLVAHAHAHVLPTREGNVVHSHRGFHRDRVDVVAICIKGELEIGWLPEAQDAVSSADAEVIAVVSRQAPAGAPPIDHVGGHILRVVLDMTRICRSSHGRCHLDGHPATGAVGSIRDGVGERFDTDKVLVRGVGDGGSVVCDGDSAVVRVDLGPCCVPPVCCAHPGHAQVVSVLIHAVVR